MFFLSVCFGNFENLLSTAFFHPTLNFFSFHNIPPYSIISPIIYPDFWFPLPLFLPTPPLFPSHQDPLPSVLHYKINRPLWGDNKKDNARTNTSEPDKTIEGKELRRRHRRRDSRVYPLGNLVI